MTVRDHVLTGADQSWTLVGSGRVESDWSRPALLMCSGLAVAVVHGGRRLLVRGFGSARLGVEEDSDVVDRPVPVTDNTKFAIASLSKAFTAALIGMLLKQHETRSVSVSCQAAPFYARQQELL